MIRGTRTQVIFRFQVLHCICIISAFILWFRVFVVHIYKVTTLCILLVHSIFFNTELQDEEERLSGVYFHLAHPGVLCSFLFIILWFGAKSFWPVKTCALKCIVGQRVWQQAVLCIKNEWPGGINTEDRWAQQWWMKPNSMRENSNNHDACNIYYVPRRHDVSADFTHFKLYVVRKSTKLLFIVCSLITGYWDC